MATATRIGAFILLVFALAAPALAGTISGSSWTCPPTDPNSFAGTSVTGALNGALFTAGDPVAGSVTCSYKDSRTGMNWTRLFTGDMSVSATGYKCVNQAGAFNAVKCAARQSTKVSCPASIGIQGQPGPSFGGGGFIFSQTATSPFLNLSGSALQTLLGKPSLICTYASAAGTGITASNSCTALMGYKFGTGFGVQTASAITCIQTDDNL
jgi:hypothetical protein